MIQTVTTTAARNIGMETILIHQIQESHTKIEGMTDHTKTERMTAEEITDRQRERGATSTTDLHGKRKRTKTKIDN